MSADYIKLTQWLTLDQVRMLLETGSVTANAGGQIVDLYLNFRDRTAAQALAGAKKKP
jgi:hypothetical protein